MTEEKKTHKTRKIIITGFATLFTLLVGGLTFFLVMLSDNGHNMYERQNIPTAEIVKRGYIRACKVIKSRGDFNFFLDEDDMNEALSNSSLIEDKRIESIYYKRGFRNHQYFYVDLKLPFLKTRLKIDTIASAETNYNITLKINKCSMGNVDVTNFLIDKGYFSDKFIDKLGIESALPIKYVGANRSFVYEPLKYIEYFPDGNLSGLTMLLAGKDKTSLEMDTTTLGFDVALSKFRNATYAPIGDLDAPVDIYSRVLSGYQNLDYDAMQVGQQVEVARVSQKELLDIFNDSLISPDVEIMESEYTTDKATLSYKAMDVSVIESSLIRIRHDVNINGYVINLNQDIICESEGSYFKLIMQTEPMLFSNEAILFNSSTNYVNYFCEVLNRVYGELASKQNKVFSMNIGSNSMTLKLDSLVSDIVNIDPRLLTLQTKTILDSPNECIKFIVTK